LKNGDIQNIHKDLQEIKDCLKGSVNKGELDKALTNVVKTDQLKNIVTNILTEIMGKCKEEFENKLKERTEKIQDNLDSLLIENEQLRETIHTWN